jgi:hypothetical protein
MYGDFTTKHVIVSVTGIVAALVLILGLVFMGYQTGQKNNEKNRVTSELCISAGGAWVYDNCIYSKLSTN